MGGETGGARNETSEKQICQNAQVIVDAWKWAMKWHPGRAYHELLERIMRNMEFSDGFDEMAEAVTEYFSTPQGRCFKYTPRQILKWLKEQEQVAEDRAKILQQAYSN